MSSVEAFIIMGRNRSIPLGALLKGVFEYCWIEQFRDGFEFKNFILKLCNFIRQEGR